MLVLRTRKADPLIGDAEPLCYLFQGPLLVPVLFCEPADEERAFRADT